MEKLNLKTIKTFRDNLSIFNYRIEMRIFRDNEAMLFYFAKLQQNYYTKQTREIMKMQITTIYSRRLCIGSNISRKQFINRERSLHL